MCSWQSCFCLTHKERRLLSLQTCFCGTRPTTRLCPEVPAHSIVTRSISLLLLLRLFAHLRLLIHFRLDCIILFILLLVVLLLFFLLFYLDGFVGVCLTQVFPGVPAVAVFSPSSTSSSLLFFEAAKELPPARKMTSIVSTTSTVSHLFLWHRFV